MDKRWALVDLSRKKEASKVIFFLVKRKAMENSPTMMEKSTKVSFKRIVKKDLE